MAKLLLFFMVLSASAEAAPSPPMPNHLAAGQPGCWRRIRAGALTDAEFKALPQACKELRTDYFLAIENSKTNAKKFEKKMVDALKQAKKPKAPYEAILFSMLIKSPDLKAALQVRADTEKKLKLPFQYASVALLRISGKECASEPSFQHEFYRELCVAEDNLLPDFFNGSKK